MDWIQDAVSEFGQRQGLPALRLDERGAAQLRVGDGGLLLVEALARATGRPEVLVAVGRNVGHQAAALLPTALERAHLSTREALPVQVGLRGTGAETLLLAAVRLPERGFTPQALGQAVEAMGRWLDQVAAGVAA